MIEYTLLTALIGLALLLDPSPLEQVLQAFQIQYGRFTMALSLP